MDSSGSPGTATFGNDGSTGMFAVPASAVSPDTQQSASSGISHDQSHSSWKEVGHAVWSRDGEKKRLSSASLSTPRRSVKGVMSPVKKEKGPSKIIQENTTLRNLAMLQESLNVMTMAMSRAFRSWSGELVCRSPYPQKIRRTTSRSCSIH